MINKYRKLLRVEQWYKNLLILFPLLFLERHLVFNWPHLIIAFLGFCATSSITYIINDWIDRKKDALHPTKKERPLASGKITGKNALITCLILGLLVISSIYLLGSFYASIIIIYFTSTNLYSTGLKNIPILDLALITFNFILRSLTGLKSIPNLDTLPFYIVLFSIIFILLNHKRRSDIKLLGDKAASHKPVLKFYTKQRLYLLRFITYIILVIGLYLLMIQGVTTIGLISIGLLTIITSIIFSKNPKIVIKPHYLFTLWYWDLFIITLIILNIVF